MNYKVWTAPKKIFATLEEAARYANEYARKTGEIVAITETTNKATHEYKEANT